MQILFMSCASSAIHCSQLKGGKNLNFTLHTHTHIYQFIGDNIHMCDYRLTLSAGNNKREKAEEMEGYELEYNAEEVTG